jgi:hypothetical protein
MTSTTPSNRSFFLGLAAILIVTFTFVAILDWRAAQDAWSKLAALGRQHAVDEKRLAGLAQALKPAAPAPAAPRPAAPSAPAAGPSDRQEKMAASRAAGQAYAQAFFAKYPQARAMLIEFQSRNIENYDGPFFRAAGLTPAQITEFVARTTQAHLDSLVLNPNGNWSNGTPNMPAEDAQALLGEKGYQQWQDATRAMPAENWVAGLASAVKNGATALTADQSSELVQVVAGSSPDYAAGKRMNPMSIDTSAVIDQAKPLLTDVQWQQAQSFLTLQAASRQL